LRERFAFEAESAGSNLVERYGNNLGSCVPDMVREFEVGDRVQQRSLLTEQQATGHQGQECLTAYTHRSESHFRNPAHAPFGAALTKVTSMPGGWQIARGVKGQVRRCVRTMRSKTS
jgi:hypothetical protein